MMNFVKKVNDYMEIVKHYGYNTIEEFDLSDENYVGFIGDTLEEVLGYHFEMDMEIVEMNEKIEKGKITLWYMEDVKQYQLIY